MSREQFRPAPHQGMPNMPVVILSTSHMRDSGAPAAFDHERDYDGVSLGQPSTSHRRPSNTVAPKTKIPTIREGSSEGEEWLCDLSVEDDVPVVRVVHRSSRQFSQPREDSTRPASAGGASAQGGVHLALCSSHKQHRSPSPMSRPETPAARPMSPMVRALSPEQAAKLASMMPPTSDGRKLPGAHNTEIVARRSSQPRSRSASWSKRHSPTPTFPSGSTLIRIYEEFEEDGRGVQASQGHSGAGRQENMDVAVPPVKSVGRRTSAAAAIAAAAVSAAALEEGIDTVSPEPCLDCLEEFVRRKRATHGATVAAKSSDSSEKVDKVPKPHHPAPAPPHQDKKGSKNSHDQSAGTASSAPAHGSSPAAAKAGGGGASTPAASSTKPPATPTPKAPEMRCPTCKACKSCGHIWPLPGNH